MGGPYTVENPAFKRLALSQIFLIFGGMGVVQGKAEHRAVGKNPAIGLQQRGYGVGFLQLFVS